MQTNGGGDQGGRDATSYLRPTDLDDALRAVPGATVVAGGTDLYPAHVERPLPDRFLDITAVAALRGIHTEPDGTIRIGAATTWSQVAGASLPPRFDGLRAAAGEVGGVQIQNAGTVGGNLCTASPAADGVPPLLTLDASAEVRSATGRRVLALADFVTGYRRTALGHDELLTAVLIPARPRPTAAGFAKLGARRYLVISIAMAAAVLGWDDDGRIDHARVAVGACSPVAARLPRVEAALLGRSIDDDLDAAIDPDHFSPLVPISDVRAPAPYRADAAPVLVRRALRQCRVQP